MSGPIDVGPKKPPIVHIGWIDELAALNILRFWAAMNARNVSLLPMSGEFLSDF